MHFLYFLVFCYASVPTLIHTYVIITGNINDIKTLAKKLSVNVPEKIKKIGQENEYKYNGEAHDEQTDKTDEYQEDNRHNQRDDIIEEVKEFITDIGKKSASADLKSVPVVSHTEPLVAQKSTNLLLDDIIGKIKQKLLQEILAKIDDERKLNAEKGYLLEGQTQFKSSIVFKDPSNLNLRSDTVIQPSLAQQLSLVQQQLDQINKTLQMSMNQPTVEGEQSKLVMTKLNSETNEVDEEILDDEDQSNNIYEDYVFEEETNPVDDTEELKKVTTMVKVTQSAEDELVSANPRVDNIEELTRVTAAVKEKQRFDENDDAEDATETLGDNDVTEIAKVKTEKETREDKPKVKTEYEAPKVKPKVKTDNETPKVKPKGNTKIRTKNFGAPVKLVLEETNNFNEEANKEIVNSTKKVYVRPFSARKVMLL